jgi:hypothetical protein
MKLIADNLRITKTDIQNALKARNSKPIQDLVKLCVAKGAWAIDVNTGPLGKLPEEGMAFFIKAVEGVTDLPLLIDTSNPAARAAVILTRDDLFSWGMVPVMKISPITFSEKGQIEKCGENTKR